MRYFKFSFIALALLATSLSAWAQLIKNYSLGEGHKYFKSNPKATILADVGHETQGSTGAAKMRGNPYFFRYLYEDQNKDSNSLLNLLKKKNPTLAREYEGKLEELSGYFKSGMKGSDNRYTQIFPNNAHEEPSLYYRRALWLTSLLETYSDYYKNTQNVNIEMELEQSKLNEDYKSKTDSIIYQQKAKYKKIVDDYTAKLSALKKDSNNFQARFDKISSGIENRYNLEVEKLKKEKKSKIDQLPQANFIKNKTVITEKYDKLIADKVAQGNSEMENAAAKFNHDHESEMDKYDNKVKALTDNVSDLNNKIEDIANNLENPLPPQPRVDESKYKEKLEKIRTEINEKLSATKLSDF